MMHAFPALLLIAASSACSSGSSTVSGTDASHGHEAGHDAGHDGHAQVDAAKDAKKHVDAHVVTDAGKDASDAPPEKADPNAPPYLTLDCDPMVPTVCGLPFPSNVWTRPDPTAVTGLQVYFGDTTLPLSQKTPPVRMSKTPFLTRDGFAQGAMILTHMPNATVTGLPSLDTIPLSVTMASPTLLMEADTGALVPHFSELDQRSTDDTQRAFMIEPLIRLKDATRYIVAIRGVVDDTGKLLPVNPVFQALRDDTPSTDLSVPPRRALYADIMSKLRSNGVDTTTLQLAWDFTTASQANTTEWLTSMRDDALAKVGATGPSYTIQNVVSNPDPNIYARLEGTMTVPYYLNTANIPELNADGGGPASINLGANGLPVQNGTASFPFIVLIPNSLVTSKKKGPILINSHGIFGVETEGEDGYFADICNREGYVGVAVQLVGMDSDDISFFVLALGSDPSGTEQAFEMQHQGLVNELLAVRMMMGGLANDPVTAPNGNPTIDPTQRFYRGDSQGGIFGSTFMAISTDVTRGLLGEPGAPYSLILNRSIDFRPFYFVLSQNYANAIDIQLGIALIETLWFRTEPGGYVGYVRGNNLLENTPSHDVIIHSAIGDPEVTPWAAELIARTIGAQSLERVNREIYGVDDAPSGFTGSGIVEWSFELPDASLVDLPPTEPSNPHSELRYVTAAQDMADRFFRTGTIQQTCPDGGPCTVVCMDAGVQTCTAVSP
jgi:hypothetical protein